MNTRVLVQRAIQLIPVLIGVSLAAFLILHLAPGDPVTLLAPDATAEQQAEIRRNLGLDRPLAIQYLLWLQRVARGDMGKSFYSNQPVILEILERFPNTLLLAGAALGFALVVGMLLGIVAALAHGTPFDRLSMIGAVLGWSMPPFWLGLILIILFGVRLQWLPTGGMFSLSALHPTPPDVARHLILPALTLGIRHMSYFARLARSTMLDVLGEDYLRTATAKGLARPVIIRRHALPNSLIPLITVAGTSAGHLLGGAVVVETVFGWPGLGTLIVTAILARDFPLVQGAILFVAVTFVVMNFLVDLAYSWIDPRIRYK